VSFCDQGGEYIGTREQQISRQTIKNANPVKSTATGQLGDDSGEVLHAYISLMARKNTASGKSAKYAKSLPGLNGVTSGAGKEIANATMVNRAWRSRLCGCLGVTVTREHLPSICL
jgi:hypothetical protein